MKKDDIRSLIFYIGITYIIGGLPSIFVYTNDLYALTLPPLYPNNIVFPIVWSILFVLMGVSAYLTKESNEAKKIYFIQLIVNALWTPLFFSLKLYFISFLWIILLIILVIKMINLFKELSTVSAYLNIPYLLWLLFAAYLNLGIVLLN